MRHIFAIALFISGSIGFIVGKRMQSSSFDMFPDDRPGTTSSQKMIENVDNNCSDIYLICFKQLTGNGCQFKTSS